MSNLGTHGLGRWSEGRHHRSSAIYDIIVGNALQSAHIPSHLEPLGLHRADGKRPEGATMVPSFRGDGIATADINNSLVIRMIINYEGGSGDDDYFCFKVMGTQPCLQDLFLFPNFIVCI